MLKLILQPEFVPLVSPFYEGRIHSSGSGDWHLIRLCYIYHRARVHWGLELTILELLILKLLQDKDAAPDSTPGFPFNYSLVAFVIETELTIRWNHIQGVDSVTGTGQIIQIGRAHV